MISEYEMRIYRGSCLILLVFTQATNGIGQGIMRIVGRIGARNTKITVSRKCVRVRRGMNEA